MAVVSRPVFVRALEQLLDERDVTKREKKMKLTHPSS